MSAVIRLADYRKLVMPQKNDISGPRYFCVKCDTDQFKIMSSGAIHCAHCTALIRNVSAAVHP